jgi:amidase
MFADYDRYDATGLAQLVREQRVHPRELVETAISRIEATNPRINAVVHKTYDTALHMADGAPEGPFTGVPFLIKDLGPMVAGEPRTLSSRFLQFNTDKEDSVLVTRYRQAGLVFLGKTNTPEFGLVATTESEFRGPARNPWNTDHSTGGSSGGSAAAVAAGYTPMAHGNDGGGSIRIPASACGLFGLKPSRGRVPHGPRFDGTWMGLAIDHVLSRSVRDSAAMLDLSCLPNPGEPYSAPAPAGSYLDDAGTDPGPLRIAVCTESLFGSHLHKDCVAAVDDAADLLESMGHHVEPACPPFDRELMVEAYLRIVAAGLASDIDAAARLVGKEPSPEYFEPTTWLLQLIGRKTSGDHLMSLLVATQQTARDIESFFDTYDVLLTPTLGRPPVRIGELNPTKVQMIAIEALRRFPMKKALDTVLSQMATENMDPAPNTELFNLTGQPAMSVPLYWNADGLPIGTQFVARYGAEATLFRLAGQLEQARPWFERRPSI